MTGERDWAVAVTAGVAAPVTGARVLATVVTTGGTTPITGASVFAVVVVTAGATTRGSGSQGLGGRERGDRAGDGGQGLGRRADGGGSAGDGCLSAGRRAAGAGAGAGGRVLATVVATGATVLVTRAGGAGGAADAGGGVDAGDVVDAAGAGGGVTPAGRPERLVRASWPQPIRRCRRTGGRAGGAVLDWRVPGGLAAAVLVLPLPVALEAVVLPPVEPAGALEAPEVAGAVVGEEAGLTGEPGRGVAWATGWTGSGEAVEVVVGVDAGTR